MQNDIMLLQMISSDWLSIWSIFYFCIYNHTSSPCPVPGIGFGIAMSGNVMGTTEKLVSTFFEIKIVTNSVAKCRRKYVKPEKFEKKKNGALICGLHFDFGAFEKHPIVAFSCNLKTARPHLKTDTIAAIEKKSLLKARASIHIKLAYYSFQNFEYVYIIMRANIARKVWLHVCPEFMIIFS